MRELLLLCFVLPTVLCSGVNTRVVGGSDASIASHKHQLSLRATDSHVCSASLISSFRAVTAAHCGGSALSAYTVLAGTADRNETSCQTCVLRTLTLFSRHPDFVNDPNVGYPNDIAVIGFNSIATSDNVDFINLATVDDGTFEGATCTTAGWGKTSATGGLADILQEASVPVISNTECTGYWDTMPIYDTQICIRSPTATACGGDSGDPLVCNGILAGSASWGSELCQPPLGLPFVYIRISSYYDWIITQ